MNKTFVERRRSTLQRETELWKQAVTAHQRLHFLGEASRLLSETLETPKVLDRLAELAVPKVADWCIVDLLDDDGQLQLAAAADVQPRKAQLVREMRKRFPPDPARHPAYRAIREDRPLFVDGARSADLRGFARSGEHLDLMRKLNPGSFVCVPLKARGSALGVLALGRSRSGSLNSADVELAQALALRAGSALDNARLYALVETQRREMKETLDTVPAMIWYKDSENRVLRCNRAAADWYGKPETEIWGKSAYDLFPDRGPEYHADDLDVIRTGQAKRGQLEDCVSPQGKRCWIRRDLLPRYDEKGNVAGVIIFAMDVTEVKRAEDSLRESERSQRDFVANVSHEFRTPVAAIKGFAETLRRGGLEDSRNRLGFVRTIESHADRLDWLVQDLLNLSRLGSGMVKFRRDVIDVPAFLRQFVESVSSLLERKALRVDVHAPAGLRVVSDHPHLVQVFDNLVSNAIRYSAPGARIRLEARAEGRACRFTVSDQGPGIAAEHLPRLFDRFYRVEKGDSGGSTGLGLHIVKTIVEAQGGRVWAESELGRGAAFHVVLTRNM